MNTTLSNPSPSSSTLTVQTLDYAKQSLKPKEYPMPTFELQAQNVFAFHKDSQEWQKVSFTESQTQLEGIKKLKFLSYNMEYSTYKKEERSAEYWRHVQETDPDFVCFQECTDHYLESLKKQEWAQKNYYFSHSIKTYNKHFRLIMSKYPLQVYETVLTTQSFRTLFFGQLYINGHKTAITNLHLEHRFHDSDFRTHQISQSFNILKDFERAFVLGDMNLDWSENEKFTNSDYIDVWPYLYPEQRGYSWGRRWGYFNFRPDRILFKKNPHINPLEMEVIGTENVLRPEGKEKPDHDREYWTISDHFGLRCTFELREDIQFQPRSITVPKVRNAYVYFSSPSSTDSCSQNPSSSSDESTASCITSSPNSVTEKFVKKFSSIVNPSFNDIFTKQENPLIAMEDATWYYDKAERLYMVFEAKMLEQFGSNMTGEWKDFLSREFKGKDRIKLVVLDDGLVKEESLQKIFEALPFKGHVWISSVDSQIFNLF